MTNPFARKALPALAALTFLFHGNLLAQPTLQNLEQTIRHYDSLFWKAFNSCDIPSQEKLYTDDLEFYHDKGGMDKGKAATLEKTRRNLCGNPNFKLRRDELPGTTRVFPLTKNDTIYGAIFSGDHVFYTSENNAPLKISGQARFTHIWLYQNKTWKMARIISYDHGPPAPSSRTIIELPAATLDLYASSYNAPRAGKVSVKKELHHLILGDRPGDGGNFPRVSYPVRIGKTEY